ncbi:hypothetical protein [Methylobacterium aerolatum]|uniref:VRR-NUC domain-containing protein n=1 Tax=Methylobacterium aerolatum TaxID=418708 RepID=A0ABU0I5N8_9HYPH|nr:hypothetical protein [Methylobacterium aerolatum]MDQ0449928.1 hypothetical protein [Methylobacterium aerolatum]
MIRMTAAEYLAGQQPRPRRPVEDVEGPVHRSVLALLRLRLGGAYLVQHTPNRPRSQVQGGREKAMGAVKGWPDLAVYGPGPAGPACWFAEIKPPGTSVPAYQRAIHDQLRGLGFDVRILRGIEDAEAALAAWRIPAAAR